MSSRSPTPGVLPAEEPRSARRSPRDADPNEVPFEFSRAWPANVPAPAYAHSFLTGKLRPPEILREFTERFLASLSPDDVQVLVHDVDGPKAALRAALLVRWRLRAALYVRPAVGPAIDDAELDALLAQTDGALGLLTATAPIAGELGPRLQAHRDELAKLAVDLSTQAAAAAAPAPAPEPRKHTPPKEVTKVVTHAEPAGRPESVRVPVVVLLGVLVAVLGGVLAYTFLYEPPKPPTLAGAPPNTITTGEYVYSLDGRALPDVQMKAAADALAKEGKALERLTASTFRIVRAAPAAPAPSTPPAAPAPSGGITR